MVAKDTSVAVGQPWPTAGLVPSPSSAVDGVATAVVESFVASLASERRERQVGPTRDAARRASCDVVEVWYHRQRRPSTLGSLAPLAVEAPFTALANHRMAA